MAESGRPFKLFCKFFTDLGTCFGFGVLDGILFLGVGLGRRTKLLAFLRGVGLATQVALTWCLGLVVLSFAPLPFGFPRNTSKPPGSKARCGTGCGATWSRTSAGSSSRREQRKQ